MALLLVELAVCVSAARNGKVCANKWEKSWLRKKQKMKNYGKFCVILVLIAIFHTEK